MKQQTSRIEEMVRDYIVERYLTPEDAAVFSNDDDLLSMLDSLQILRMIIDIESQFSIHVASSELAPEPENLGTVSKMAGFIERKLECEGAKAT
jgi:acyl carrier protein